MKIVILAIVCASFSFSPALHSAEPTVESVEKLFAVTKVEASIVAVRSGSEQRMKAMIAQMMSAYPDNPKLKALSDPLAARISKQFSDALTWEKLKDDYIKLYRKTFTQEEVDAQIAFYETPVGKLVVEKSPGLSVESSRLLQAHYLPVVKDMQVIIKEEMENVIRGE